MDARTKRILTVREYAASGVLRRVSSLTVGLAKLCHVSGISVTPDGQFVFVADLGRNSVFMYALRQDGQLAELAEHVLHEGAGPRHLAFAQGIAESPWVPQCVLTRTHLPPSLVKRESA